MVLAHQDTCEEGTTTTFPPQEIWHGSPYPQNNCTAVPSRASWPVASPPGMATDRKALQWVVRTAQYITGAKLPDIFF
jgi:hypothetical protein